MNDVEKLLYNQMKNIPSEIPKNDEVFAINEKKQIYSEKSKRDRIGPIFSYRSVQNKELSAR